MIHQVPFAMVRWSEDFFKSMNIKYFIYKYLYQIPWSSRPDVIVKQDLLNKNKKGRDLCVLVSQSQTTNSFTGRHVLDKVYCAQSLINTSDEKMWLHAGQSAILWLKAKPLNGQKPQVLWDRWSLSIITLMCYSKA